MKLSILTQQTVSNALLLTQIPFSLFSNERIHFILTRLIILKLNKYH